MLSPLGPPALAAPASLLHRHKLAGPLATRLIGREPLITFVTLGELTKWADIRARVLSATSYRQNAYHPPVVDPHNL